ncbi:hypothetical protein [Thalassomonas sp. RHCl1]|uniref:hypothetical protein n=1 Tax=Thalassomonas sp. RHCl1 TaxID=2995320 RepID=UPI00248CA40E|nr:hypothetical protein [Thalassomonas sp. RHCl1]
MTITTTALTQEQYNNLRYELIKLVEEGGHENLDLYPDSNGLVTTGVGFNLHESIVLNKVLELGLEIEDENIRADYIIELLPVINEARGQTQAEIQAALDAKWLELNGEGEFKIPDAQTVRTIFDALADDVFEPALNNRLVSEGITGLSGNGGNYSLERLALISLEYNNGNALIQDGLKNALKNGDRFEAWYQIRYESNGDNSAGIAKRRFFESSLFGLFNSANPTVSEAENAVDGFIGHLAKIQSVENQYGSQVANARSDYASFVNANNINIAGVGELFKPIAGYILERFSPADGSIDLTQFAHSINGQVMLGITDGNGDIASSVKGTAGDGNDLLVAVENKSNSFSGNCAQQRLKGNTEHKAPIFIAA